MGTGGGREPNEKSEFFARERYNSKGIKIANSYNWRIGNLDGDDAQKFRGRGFKQLTGLTNYVEYWTFMGWLKLKDNEVGWDNDKGYLSKNRALMKKHPPAIDNPEIISTNPHYCIDSGGFFLACERPKMKPVMSTVNDNTIEAVTRAINGRTNGLIDRQAHTYRINYIIGDTIDAPKYFKAEIYAKRFGFAFKEK